MPDRQVKGGATVSIGVLVNFTDLLKGKRSPLEGGTVSAAARTLPTDAAGDFAGGAA
jgi:hypothetical protein